MLRTRLNETTVVEATARLAGLVDILIGDLGQHHLRPENAPRLEAERDAALRLVGEALGRGPLWFKNGEKDCG